MKNWMMSAPLALLLATAAVAQTDPAAEQPEGSGYGAGWPEAVGSAFMSDEGGTMTLRADADLAAGWTSLTQEDRDMVKADCTKFQADVAAGTAMGSEATGTMTDDTTTGEGAGTSGDAAPKMALSVEDMTRLCTSVMAM